MTLRAVVIGTGWAGEGYTTALRAAGVDVVAICGRTPEPARAMADKLGITDVRFDRRQALEEIQPDIVAIATPTGSHCEMATFAAELGCHILCEKSLASHAAEARAMLRAVEWAGVKHAYGVTSRYAPVVVYARTLLADGLIGQLREIESLLHFHTSPLLPYSWFHQLSAGGGALNLDFPHVLGQILYLTSGTVQVATGEARQLIDRAPVGVTVHDFREYLQLSIDPEQAAAGEWRAVDADMGYTILARLAMPDGHRISVLCQRSEMAMGRHPDYLALYGTEGTLHLGGGLWPMHIHHFDHKTQTWADILVPDEVVRSLSQGDDPIQRGWNQLCREFVAAVRGEGCAGYPTFMDGWIANEIIDIVRSGRGWTSLTY